MKRSVEEYTYLLSGLAMALCIAPLAILRTLKGEYIIAIMDVYFIAGITGFSVYLWSTRKINSVKALLNIFIMTSILAALYIQGIEIVYWIYPASMISFFLSSIRKAFVINMATATLMFPIVYRDTDIIESMTIVLALMLANVSAFIFASQTERQRQQLSEQATQDPLTGIGNRRALVKKVYEAVELKARHNTSTTLIILDLDHFKSINDSYGHTVGDQTLKRVCQLLQENIRVTDKIYRYGGEEFIVVSTTADINDISNLSEKLRVKIANSEDLFGFSITSSFGVAELREKESAEEWLSRADQALYQAKASGRNKVCLA